MVWDEIIHDDGRFELEATGNFFVDWDAAALLVQGLGRWRVQFLQLDDHRGPQSRLDPGAVVARAVSDAAALHQAPVFRPRGDSGQGPPPGGPAAPPGALVLGEGADLAIEDGEIESGSSANEQFAIDEEDDDVSRSSSGETGDL